MLLYACSRPSFMRILELENCCRHMICSAVVNRRLDYHPLSVPKTLVWIFKDAKPLLKLPTGAPHPLGRDLVESPPSLAQLPLPHWLTTCSEDAMPVAAAVSAGVGRGGGAPAELPLSHGRPQEGSR